MFRNFVPRNPGVYWANHKELSLPEVVVLHIAITGDYVRRIGDSKLYKASDFFFGPHINEPELIPCPRCPESDDYHSSHCSRCQNQKEIWSVRRSECYIGTTFGLGKEK